MNEAIYKKHLQELVNKLIAKYDQLGLRASGKYADGLEIDINDNHLIIWSEKHAGAMEGGIRASGHPFGPVRAIFDWLEVKQGLPAIFYEKKKSFAFAIAKKIANEGIKVPNEFNQGNVVSDVLDEFLNEGIYEMLNEIGDAYAKQIQSDVIQLFKQVA